MIFIYEYYKFTKHIFQRVADGQFRLRRLQNKLYEHNQITFLTRIVYEADEVRVKALDTESYVIRLLNLEARLEKETCRIQAYKNRIFRVLDTLEPHYKALLLKRFIGKQRVESQTDLFKACMAFIEALEDERERHLQAQKEERKRMLLQKG